MGITSSEIIVDSEQSNNQRAITEEHIDHLGGKHHIRYMAPSGFDAETTMANRVASIEEGLADSEDSEAINGSVENGEDPLAFSPEFSTVKRFIKKLIRYGMRTKDVRVVLVLKPVIDYLEGEFNPNQIANYLDTTIAVLARIKTRVNAIWAIKTTLDADEALVEEVE